MCVSSLRRGHANLLCIVPILSYETAFTPLRARWLGVEGIVVGFCSRVGFDHINRNAPVLIRTPKLTRFEPAQYWGGGPPGNSVVLNPFFFFFSSFVFVNSFSFFFSFVFQDLLKKKKFIASLCFVFIYINFINFYYLLVVFFLVWRCLVNFVCCNIFCRSRKNFPIAPTDAPAHLTHTLCPPCDSNSSPRF